MKFNRKEYDLIYDAFQYMYFKMTKEQKILAEQILDLAFYAPDKGSHEMLEGLGLDPATRQPKDETSKDHDYLLSFTSKWFTKKS